MKYDMIEELEQEIRWERHTIIEYDKDKSFDADYYSYLGDKEKHIQQANWYVDNFKFDTFLEIGPGNCGMLEEMKKKGKQVTGVEYVKNAIEKFAPKNITIINTPVWDMGELKDPFDIFMCFSVLQLIPMDKREQAVKEIYRLTKKYAFLVIPHIPQNPVPGEEWIVSPKIYEKNKDRYKTLVRFEPIEYWYKLFEQTGFKRVINVKPMPSQNKGYFLFEK